MTPWIGITWGISNKFGWGVYGLNLAKLLLETKTSFPVCLENIAVESLTEEDMAVLAPAIRFKEQNLKHFMSETQVARLKDAIVLHALGNDANWSLVSQCVEGDINIGVIFFEYSEISSAGLARLSKLNQVIAGSSWNAKVLKDYGVQNVETVLQGVNTDIFRPQPRTGTYDGKFAIFSGGKLDFRKGQDIVLAGFREFSRRHEDAVLVTAWQNLWPLTASQVRFSPHIDNVPWIRANNSIDVVKWAADNGVDPEKIVDLGMVPNEQMPAILAEMDIAVFPNRCEGGTNLVAMETMACGVPSVISANTGHMDLINDNENGCYILENQGPVSLEGHATRDWGESSVDELVSTLERAYGNRQEAKEIGQNGANFMQEWSWPSQIRSLLSTIEMVAT